ncbi:uncharacterized protein LOC143188525 isoform X2 [Calliopsis andreniformis]|uniref:uncharacterized protein LOC143188525 isoform X2 n=1 Tax=Calliopsis andreniformis TaxID=337506 RepID=UPI003FCD764A
MESLRKSSSSPTSIPSDEEHDREGLVLLKEPGRKSDVKETISMLETRGKKLCSDLMSLQMDRAELTREVEVLSQHLMEKKQAGSLGKSTACMHRCYRQFPGCVNENYNHLFSAAEVGLGPDWSKIFTWPDVHSFGMVSTGLENEIFGNCERLRCKSCCLRRMCNREDMKFFRCSKLKRGRARNCSLPKISSCRSCKLNRCKGDILFPTELEELSPFSNCNCTCNICATENLNTRSSSSISCELEADSSSEFPVLENASNTMENWNSLEIHEEKSCANT